MTTLTIKRLTKKPTMEQAKSAAASWGTNRPHGFALAVEKANGLWSVKSLMFIRTHWREYRDVHIVTPRKARKK